MAFLHVNSTGGATASAVQTFTLTIPAVTANNLVVITAKWGGANTSAISATDSASNTYAVASGPTAGGLISLAQFYGVATTGGATSVTITWVSTSSIRLCVDEFSGNATTNATVFDTVAFNSGTGTSASVTLAPTNASELIAVGVAFATSVTSPTAGTNYLLGVNNVNASSQYRLSGTTSETAPMAWTGSVGWLELAGAYNPSGTVVTTSPRPLPLLGAGG